MAADPEDMLPGSITKWVSAGLGLTRPFFSYQCRLRLFHGGCGPGGGAYLLRGRGVGFNLLSGSDHRVRLFRIFSLSDPVPVPCRPFDRERAGLSVGEGGAFIMLMSQERAERLGRLPDRDGCRRRDIQRCPAHHLTGQDRCRTDQGRHGGHEDRRNKKKGYCRNQRSWYRHGI